MQTSDIFYAVIITLLVINIKWVFFALLLPFMAINARRKDDRLFSKLWAAPYLLAERITMGG